MTESEKINEAIGYWMRMSQESLDSAEDEFKAGRLSFAINRAYYACFYAASAILLSKGKGSPNIPVSGLPCISIL